MPKQCHELYGFRDFSNVKRIIYAAFDLRHKEPKGVSSIDRLSLYEQCLIGLMYIESGMTQI